MSITSVAKKIAKQFIPASGLNYIKNLRQRISPLDLTAPVLQMYVNDSEISTHICINNFYSFLAPSVETTAVLEIIFYDANGKKILKLKEKMQAFQSRFVDVAKTLSSQNIESELGVVTLQLRPINPRKSAYKRFGTSSSHFFQLYHGSNGSVAMIHPSSLADPKNKASDHWISNQTIDTNGLKKIVLYQCNPSYVAHQMKHFLMATETSGIVTETTSTIPPLGTQRIDFNLSDLPITPDRLTIGVDALPSANSKPMLARVYSEGRFSMSHS